MSLPTQPVALLHHLAVEAAAALCVTTPEVGDTNDPYLPAVAEAAPMCHPAGAFRHPLHCQEPAEANSSQVQFGGMASVAVEPLLVLGRPANVPRRVIPVVVDPVQAVEGTFPAVRSPGWAWPYVLEKGMEVVPPRFAHADTTPSVAEVESVLWVVASPLCCVPSSPLDCVVAHRVTSVA